MRIQQVLVAATATAALLVAPAWAQQQGTSPPPKPPDRQEKNIGTTGTNSTAGPASPTGTTGAVSTAPVNAAAMNGTAPDYRLVPGDKLRIEVYKDQQLSQSLQVRPDGKITLPLLGDLQAAGHTPSELRDRIATALREYVTNPTVTVIVVETVAPTVFVMGEVNSPGSIAMSGPMTVMQALAMAGGFKDFANTKNIRILRKTSRGVQTIGFNYKEAARGAGEMVMLAPGDTVIVP
jgi:polysaccharide export outer membrane protein